MVVYECDIEDCVYKTADVAEAAAVVYLTTHMSRSHAPSSQPKAPKIDPPKITQGTMIDGWELFHREWLTYSKAAGVPKDLEGVYVINCCDDDLRANLHKEDPEISNKGITHVLAAIKRLAVVRVASCVLQTELLSIKQEHAEPIRQFHARAWGKARSCILRKTCDCGCNKEVDYSDHLIKMVVLNGIYDEDIRKEVLGMTTLDDLNLNDTVGLIETKECASRSVLNNSVNTGRQDASYADNAATSTYKKIAKSDKRLNIKAKCEECQEEFKKHGIRSGKGKDDELVTYKVCLDCYRKARKKRRSAAKQDGETAEESSFGFLCGMEAAAISPKGKRKRLKGKVHFPKSNPPQLFHFPT